MAKYEFKVGDRVQFKEWDEMEKEFGGVDKYGDIRFSCKMPIFNSRMKHLCGTYATVKEIISNKRRVCLSDMTARGDKIWIYTFDMLKPANAKKRMDEPKKSSPEPVYPTITAHTIEGNKTTVMLSDGRIGEVTCYYKDTFDPAVGLAEAYKKALTSNDYKLSAKNITCGTIHSDNISCVGKPKVVEVRRKAKVGEWVKIVKAEPSRSAKIKYRNGDILQIIGEGNSACDLMEYSKEPFCVVIPYEYVVLENYIPPKKAETPPDKPEIPKPKFEVGKKYVIGRGSLFNGSVIQIDTCKHSGTQYKYTYKNINGEESFFDFFDECSTLGNSLTPYTEPEIKISPDWERVLYVVKKLREEKASNQVKEVKRQANAGEYIKLIHKRYSFDHIGEILKVNGVLWGTLIKVKRPNPDLFGGRLWMYDSSDYVVLEGYQPEK